MFLDLGKINYLSKKTYVNIKIDELNEGANNFDEHIIYKKKYTMKYF